ncbi:hypothetical protein HYALB_00012338 [Hymenoscyphus albidus]|uniref:Uncharacterized protein n=1 Tax=Hymenoscyphus albidus TaxID=595503 RepID=A0A9N9LHQ8_9HELO|nr:hypothetical protein HYALB_00012338 [Hymenoscyphus albidus]
MSAPLKSPNIKAEGPNLSDGNGGIGERITTSSETGNKEGSKNKEDKKEKWLMICRKEEENTEKPRAAPRFIGQ